MKDGKSSFNILESIKNHIETLKPLLPQQALVCIGEYPIKIFLKEPYVNKANETLPILIGKSSDDIFKWIPKGYDPYFILGFEDADIDTHFWYNVLPFISKDETLIGGLKKKTHRKTAQRHNSRINMGWNWQRFITNLNIEIQSLKHTFTIHSHIALKNTAHRCILQHDCIIRNVRVHRCYNSSAHRQRPP